LVPRRIEPPPFSWAQSLNTLLFTPDGAWTISDVKSAEAPRVLAILRERAQWLQAKGLDQWKEFVAGGEDILARRFREGMVLLVERGGQDAACAVLQWKDPFWGDLGADGRSVWVHSLAVRRTFAGRGLGKRLLAFIESMGLASRKDFCRLDVIEANGRLKAYYRALGYKETAVQDFNGKALRLMEKNLR
jgi:ribosomal protein S18 acetylase RimI-like enzyme